MDAEMNSRADVAATSVGPERAVAPQRASAVERAILPGDGTGRSPRRVRMRHAASAMAQKLAALASIADRASPVAAMTAAPTGPAAKPAYRAASTIPLARVQPRVRGERRDERELRRLAGRRAGAQQRRQHEDGRDVARAEGEPDRQARLGERGDRHDVHALESIGDPPRQRRSTTTGNHRRGEEGGHRQARAGEIVHRESEGDKGQHVPGGRQERAHPRAGAGRAPRWTLEGCGRFHRVSSHGRSDEGDGTDGDDNVLRR
jgi:hypothetical protein